MINTRHALAKERGWKERPPSKAAFIAAALEDNNLLRRPITIVGRELLVGYDEEALTALLR